MARIRTIKPEFWTDERLTECSLSARLLFIAALNFADDYGNLDRSARQLKGQAFPHDDIDCDALIRELLRAGSLIEYKVADSLYLHIKNFEKHQLINHKSKPRLPLYDDSVRTPMQLPEPSGSPPVALLALREGNGAKRKAAEEEGNGEKPTARGTRLPEDWPLTEKRRDFAASLGLQNIERIFANFSDHWIGMPGGRALKREWDRAWHTWCRNEIDRQPRANGHAILARRDEAAWAEAHAAAKAIGFRPPGINESVGAYMTDIKLQRDTPPKFSLSQLAARAQQR